MKAIFAMAAANRAIGYQGGLPWHLPEDLAHFKRLTRGAALAMGRRTWESLPGILKGRQHLVLSRSLQPSDLPAEVELLRDPAELLAREAAGDFPHGLWLIGGADLFGQMLEHIEELWLTRIFGDYPGDTFLPAFEHQLGPVEIVQHILDPLPSILFERWPRLPQFPPLPPLPPLP